MRGFGPFIGWLLVIGLFLLAPFILMGIRPEMKYILMFVIALGIYNFVRMFMGDGLRSILITGVLFYLLVWQHFWETTFLWWLNILIGLGIFSVVGWSYIWFAQVFHRR